MELLERDSERRTLETAIDASSALGRVAVVAGEAGIGKTALVTEVCGTLAGRRVLWGACDPLITPRAMGPLRDVARQAGGAMLAALDGDGSREDVLAAALDELGGSAVIVIEDLHWADDGTLDLVALLGRRLVRSPGCMILTCRTEGLAERPEVRRVLAGLPRECLIRLHPEPLTAGAVATLAQQSGRDASDLHAASGGNPFFVTEVLAAAAGDGVPASVRDAVALRVDGLSPAARSVVELAAVVPGATELRLFGDTVGAGAGAIDECIAAGLLTLRSDAVAFRHDLTRRAVEDELSPVRCRELDRLVLDALLAGDGADPARLAHHARRAGHVEAIRRLAPEAARAASRSGGHRQATEHWEAALAAEEGADPAARAEALEGVAVEAYLCGHVGRAQEARRALLAIHEAAGDTLRAGDDLRWLSRLAWWAGDGEEAVAIGDRSIEVLEQFPDSRELAMALSGRSQLAMLAEHHDVAVALGTRAEALARGIGDDETVAHALTNVGSALGKGEQAERGRAMLDEAFTLAAGSGHDDHAARALVNLAIGTLMQHRDDPRVGEDIERGLRFAFERGLDGYAQYLLGARAALRLWRGAWAAAEADANAALELGHQIGVSTCPALVVLGRLRTRRGEPAAAETIEEAWRVAVATGELQRLAPVAVTRAEHAWLEADTAAMVAATRDIHALAHRRGDVWARAELALWLWRAGEPVPVQPDDPAPYARSIAGDWRGAAEAWAAMGFPYERALALADADDEDARLEALRVLDDHGAARPALMLRRRMRAEGMRRVPRGPRASSKRGPAGLTPRQVDVLDLLAAGATNAEIATALVIAPKTVDHHVSAVLQKLGVASRREAAAAASRLASRA